MRTFVFVSLFLLEFVRSQTEVQLPPLPYEYNALEPILSEHLMKLHHLKHHRTYAEKTNGAFRQMSTSDRFVNASIETILTHLDEIDEKFRLTFRQHAGGFLNHQLFFAMLRSPNEENQPEGKIRTAIEINFQSFNNFQQIFTTKAMNVFGSGWLWLYIDGQTNQLVINSTANQDNPIMFDRNHRVVLGIDLWEHAYYPVYENRRNEYIEKFWQIINWSFVDQLYADNIATHLDL